jgi:hypothetical protein
MEKTSLVPLSVERSIRLVRGHRVMLDEDQAVKRNIERFPADFMFQLTSDEAARLRSQTVTMKVMRGQHKKYEPHTPVNRNPEAP